MNRSEPFSLTELIRTQHINDVYNDRNYVSQDIAVAATRNASVVLCLRIDEPQGDGLLIWHRGEALPRLLYIKR